jgi:hypothetical protein
MSAVLASRLDPGAHYRHQGKQAAVAALQPQTPGGALRLGTRIYRSRSG